MQCYLLPAVLIAYLLTNVLAYRALGLGATRGRLYIKHPDIFKVIYTAYYSLLFQILLKKIHWRCQLQQV